MRLSFAVLCCVCFLVLVGTASPQEKKSELKSEATGTLTLGGKTYKLANALAYENTVSNRKSTVVILSEKPLDLAKLKQSFKKNGNDEDFFPFDAHVKLTFREADKGALSQLAIYADGDNVIRIGDENVKAMATFKDGTAKGSAGTKKPDKVRNMPFEFDLTFDVKMTKP
jgi:hypothetical protein